MTSVPCLARCRAVLLPKPALPPVTRAMGAVVVLMTRSFRGGVVVRDSIGSAFFHKAGKIGFSVQYLITIDTVNKLESMQIFVRVAELASFTRAAETLGIQKATASVAVQGLETAL